MEWLGYTTQHLNGNICILSLIIILIYYDRLKYKAIRFGLLFISAVTFLIGLYMADTGNWIVKLF